MTHIHWARPTIWTLGAGAALVVLAGCTTMPNGPSALVLPGSGKTFDQFRNDDQSCRGYAQIQLGGNTAQQASVDSGVRSAALGTAVGALAGAAIGGHNSVGAGAGTGLAFGTMAGLGAGESSGYALQQRYDFAYQQCMYASGNRVPVAGGLASAPAPAPASGALPPPNAAYPPPNTPPPPLAPSDGAVIR